MGNIVFNEPNGISVIGDMQSSHGYLRRQHWTNALATAATRLKSGQATSSSATTVVTSFTAQPDFARVISITPGGTTADVAAGNITVAGTNIRDEVISEDVAIAANASTAVTTTKAFKTVTSVTFPIQDGSGATYSIGITDAMGLDRCMSEAAVFDAYMDGTRETTAATVTFSASDISKNTVDPNTALDGSKDLTVAYMATEVTLKNGTTA
jgi:hypothetical protein